MSMSMRRPPPPPQCRRTASRTALASHAGIWVTGSILRQAIGRHRHRCASLCRRISSHSGPLESRRRLGKRRMTGIMPSASVHPPIWHFEVASAPGAWKWEPPTTSAARTSRKQEPSLSGLFNKFIRWLEKSDADRPFIEPPLDDVATVEPVAAEAKPISETREQCSLPDIRQQELLTPTALPKEISKLRASISVLDEVDDGSLHQLCKTCRRSLRRRVERGDLSVEGLLLALEPFDEAAKSRISDPKTANKLAAMIRRTILTAMDTHSRDSTTHLQHLWMAFAAKICASKGSNHDIQLFWRMMCTMPGLLRARISSDQIFGLTRSFVVAQAKRHNLFAHWSARAARFADVLPRLSEAQREALESDMNVFLTQETRDPEMARRMRFSWLTIKAYDASTTGQVFVNFYRHVVQINGAPLNSLQLWQLMAGRLKSAGVLEKEDFSTLIEVEYISVTHRWTTLAVAALRSSEGSDAGLRELCANLKGIGEMDSLAQAITLLPPHQTRVDVVQAVAIASDDHELALQLYQALESNGMSEQQMRQWDWKAWRPYVERIIKDPEVEPSLWQVLNLTRRDDGNRGDPEQAAEGVRAKMHLLNQMGLWYLEAPHLNDRQVLRRVGKCVSAQRTLTEGVTSQTLVAVMEVVTRDLQKGEMGRTTRLDWLVGMIAQTQGADRADLALTSLRGWRWMIDRAHKNSS